MKATELRIGNLVMVNNPKHHPKLKNKVLSVCGMDKLRHDESGRIQLNHIDDIENITLPAVSQFDRYIEPVPLTEEWMVKLGGNNMTGWYGLDFEIKVWDETVEFTFELMDGLLTFYANELPIMTRETPYVHQLQNLYFALTGKELDIKD